MFTADTYFKFKLLNKLILISSVILGSFVVGGCSLIPPVQEMSNARQSLQAAKLANAQVHDYKGFSEAEGLLELASKKIDLGEYAEARELAIRARSIAIKSRQYAVHKTE